MGEVPLTIPPSPMPAAQFYEEPGDYILDKTLSGNAESLLQAAQVDSDSDFLLLAVVGSSTGAYNLRVYLSNRRSISNAYVKNTNYVGSANFPVPFLKEIYYPAGSSIAVDLKDTSGSSNTIQLVFKGIKRFRIG
jgi:hypothetical protein